MTIAAGVKLAWLCVATASEYMKTNWLNSETGTLWVTRENELQGASQLGGLILLLWHDSYFTVNQIISVKVNRNLNVLSLPFLVNS